MNNCGLSTEPEAFETSVIENTFTIEQQLLNAFLCSGRAKLDERIFDLNFRISQFCGEKKILSVFGQC